MIELLTGEVMMGALADILIWCLVFVGIYILCRIQRIKKDIIGNALEDTGKMKKYNKMLVNLINKDVYDKKSIRKALSKIKYIAKNTRSIIQVYQFEKGEDEDLGLVASLLSSIIDETSEFAMAFNTKSKENAISALNKTEGDLKKIEMILSAEIKTREEEALARI